MALLPPGILIKSDSSNALLGVRNLKIKATQGPISDPATVTITFDIVGAIINRSDITVADMKGKSHFAFLSQSTEYLDEKGNLAILVDPIDPASKGGIVDTYLFYSFSNGKVGGAGPKEMFKNLKKQRKISKK